MESGKLENQPSTSNEIEPEENNDPERADPAMESPLIKKLSDDLQDDDWRRPYVTYLTNKELPEDPKLESKVLRNAWQYQVITDSSGNPQLHRKSKKLSPLHRCISTQQGKAILQEIHQGSCGNHFAGRNLANKEYTQGYW